MVTRKIYILIVLTGVAGLLTLSWFLQTPNAGKKISAFMISAEYLGSDNVVLQAKNNNCGPCALKMIFDYYKIPATVYEIEKTVSLNEKGTSLLALQQMAEMKGLKTVAWRLTLHDFLETPFPSLLFINSDHYIIADSVKNEVVYIRDPAIGRLKMKGNKLLRFWKGETLVFQK